MPVFHNEDEDITCIKTKLRRCQLQTNWLFNSESKKSIKGSKLFGPEPRRTLGWRTRLPSWRCGWSRWPNSLWNGSWKAGFLQDVSASVLNPTLIYFANCLFFRSSDKSIFLYRNRRTFINEAKILPFPINFFATSPFVLEKSERSIGLNVLFKTEHKDEFKKLLVRRVGRSYLKL